MGNDGFLDATLSNHSEVVQILDQFLVAAKREDDPRLLLVLVSYVL
jgi:hypothetical protein